MDSNFRTITTSRDSPNPLRPYYVPPSIDLPNESYARPKPSTSTSQSPSFGASARDILSDLDYAEYLSDSSPSVAEMAKRLLDQAVWNYSSVMMAQPFEVAKTILQVHHEGESTESLSPRQGISRQSTRHANEQFEDYPSEDSDNDSPSYFTSTPIRSNSYSNEPSTPSRRHGQQHSQVRTPTSTSGRPSHASHASYSSHPSESYKLELKHRDSLLEVIGQLWQKESAWGVWKGTNATFIYSFLLKTIESWTRGLLAALFNVPDPGLMRGSSPAIGGLDVVDSQNPFGSLIVAVAAAGVAGVVLAPLDLVRTRLILTPISSTPRNLLPSLKNLPALSIEPSLLPATLTHSTIPRLLSASTPLFIRNTLRVDPFLAPATYSMCTFFSSVTELFVKLPFETVLRRAQASTLRKHHDQHFKENYQTFRRPSSPSHQFRTVVDIGPYRGVAGTLWFIVNEEGTTALTPVESMKLGRDQTKQKRSKGQGVHGLWKGWRVGFWGLVGVWSAAALGGGAGGVGEF